MARSSNVARIRATFAALAQVPDKVLPAVIDAHIRDVARDVEQAAPNDSGQLRDGIQVEALGGLSGGLTIQSDHAAAQECGTSRMVAHPFFRPTIRRARPGFKARLIKAIASGVRKLSH